MRPSLACHRMVAIASSPADIAARATQALQGRVSISPADHQILRSPDVRLPAGCAFEDDQP